MNLGDINLDSIMNVLRSKSPAWVNAKYEHDQVVEVPFNKMKKRRDDPSSLEQVLERTYEYLSGRLGGCLECLTLDDMIVDYDVRCNLDRPARFEAECLGMSFRVSWTVEDIVAKLYEGEASKVVLPADLMAILHDKGLKSLNKLADSTGLSVKDVRKLKAQERNMLVTTIRSASSGQNKITRLVKGCLMYLDHLGRGSVEYGMPAMHTMIYNVDSLVKELEYSDRAYVFSDQEKSHVSNWVLYAMCEEYPHPVIGGCEHITIPTDAEHVVLVSYSPEQGKATIGLTAELIWGTLVHYANNFRLGRDLEKALAIACSLHQNRYLKAVGLPRVLSKVDMIYPMLATMTGGVSINTFLDLDSATILGRVHQMLMLLLIKDVDTSARSTSSLKGLVDRNVLSMMSSESHSLEEYIEDKSVIDILKITAPMLWINHLTSEGLKMVRKFSVFESFWLLRYPKELLRGGVIANLKKGMKHPIGVNRVEVNIDSFGILLHEIELGGGPSDFKMPSGAFNVSFSCMRRRAPKLEEVVFLKRGRMRRIQYREGSEILESVRGGTLPCKQGSSYVRVSDAGGWSDVSDGEGRRGYDDEDGDEEDEEEEEVEEVDVGSWKIAGSEKFEAQGAFVHKDDKSSGGFQARVESVEPVVVIGTAEEVPAVGRGERKSEVGGVSGVEEVVEREEEAAIELPNFSRPVVQWVPEVARIPEVRPAEPGGPVDFDDCYDE